MNFFLKIKLDIAFLRVENFDSDCTCTFNKCKFTPAATRRCSVALDCVSAPTSTTGIDRKSLLASVAAPLLNALPRKRNGDAGSVASMFVRMWKIKP